MCFGAFNKAAFLIINRTNFIVKHLKSPNYKYKCSALKNHRRVIRMSLFVILSSVGGFLETAVGTVPKVIFLGQCGQPTWLRRCQNWPIRNGGHPSRYTSTLKTVINTFEMFCLVPPLVFSHVSVPVMQRGKSQAHCSTTRRLLTCWIVSSLKTAG